MSSALYSILVNGVSKGFFKSSRGLRQGDPLSPLFIPVIEALRKLISKAEEVGPLEGWQISPNKPQISILQFADDTLLFTQANLVQIRILRSILLLFEAALGLKINLSKSTILGVGDCTHLDEMASIMVA